MNGVEVERFVGGDVFIMEHKIAMGRVLGQHAHGHDHLSYLVEGTVEVTIGDEVKDYTAPCTVFVPAHTLHCIAALTDVVWLCIWNADYLTGQEA